MPWRAEDEGVLQRLQDETVVLRLHAFMTGGAVVDAHPRVVGLVSGLVMELRKRPSGTDAVDAALSGDVARLARHIEALTMADCSPTLLHHLALFYARVAAAIDPSRPEVAAAAWVRSLAAWLVLAEERAYLATLTDAVVGVSAVGIGEVEASRSARIPPERVPLETIAILARSADEAARDLGPAGRVALLALSRTDEAARIAGATQPVAHRLRAEAERVRNAAIESALAVIGEGIDEASVRGELTTTGRVLLLKAVPVWAWTSNDEAVEHFVVDRVDKIGWELYRARNWDALRQLLEPYRLMFDSLALRISRDPTQVAYAAGCAQMFVFLAEVERALPRKLELAERAVKVCPVHRNGRLVLAAALCEDAMETMRSMVFFARRQDIQRVEALLARTEALYPETRDLTEAKGMLERVKKGRIAV
jgi:hypothetical protein